MNIATRITKLRETAGWSKNSLAKKSGLSQAYISQLEAGQKEPTALTLQKLCSALGLTLADFFAEDAPALSPDLRQLLQEAEALTPEQRRKLVEFIKVMKGGTLW